MKKFKLLICLYMYSFSLANAQVLTEGNHLESFMLKDQFGKNVAINEQIRLIIFSSEKSTLNLVELAYEATPVAQRHGSDTVFISDISKMPEFIRRFVALPALRDKNYTVLIDNEGHLTRNFPTESDKVTLIFLSSAFHVSRIVFTGSVDDLKKLLIKKPI